MAACRSGAATTFVCALGSDAGGQLARMLAAADGIDLRDIAVTDPEAFTGLVEVARKALPADVNAPAA